MAERLIIPKFWNGITVNFTGYEACVPGQRFGPAIREYYLIHYVLSGTGTFYPTNRTYSIGKGDLFLIHPGELTTYQASQDDPWKYAWIALQIAQPPSFLEQSVVQLPNAERIFTYIRDHFMEERTDGKLYSLVYELLWLLSQEHMETDHSPQDYAAYAMSYLELSFMQPISIQKIADSLHIDRRYLTEVFRRTYGISPKGYLTQLRLEKAKSFIADGYSVTEAASMAGFSDLSNFSKQYKAYYGTCPRNSRKP